MNRLGKIVRNVLYTLLTQCAAWALSLAVTLYLPGYLKDTGLGAVTLAFSVAGVFSVLTGLGTSTVLVKEIARDPAQIRTLLPAAIALRLLLTPAALIAGWGAAQVLGYPTEMRTLILVAVLVTALGSVNDALGSALRGLEEFGWLNSGALVERLLTSALTIALVFAHGPLWSFVAVGAIGSALSLALMQVRLNRVLPDIDSIDNAVSPLSFPARLRRLTALGMPYLTNTLFVTVYGNSAPVLLGRMSGLAAVGWFGLAKRLAGTTLVLPVAITQAALPTLARLHTEGDERAFGAAVRRLTHLMLVTVMPFAVILILAPGPILSLLHYPPAFRGSIPVLMVMGGAIVLWYLSQALGTALIAADRQVVFSRITGGAALVSVPLGVACIFLTEHFWRNGATGAVLSDVLMEAGMVWAYARALPPGAEIGRGLATGIRAAAAVLPTVGALYLTPPDARGTFVLSIGVGLALYLPLCWVLRCFHPEDIQLLRSLGRRRALA